VLMPDWVAIVVRVRVRHLPVSKPS